ncbi:MAG: OmpW family protein, partial [Robiginitomaculum sp.]|nr:OmpW family protein [Robiginitomaculum sp.]
LFFANSLPDVTPLVNIDYDASIGPAIQAGVDIKFDKDSDWFFNIDVKKIWMNTDVTIDAGGLGMVTADVDIDPWLFGVGFGRRF